MMRRTNPKAPGPPDPYLLLFFKLNTTFIYIIFIVLYYQKAYNSQVTYFIICILRHFKHLDMKETDQINIAMSKRDVKICFLAL